jgi:hypothetical protein
MEGTESLLEVLFVLLKVLKLVCVMLFHVGRVTFECLYVGLVRVQGPHNVDNHSNMCWSCQAKP